MFDWKKPTYEMVIKWDDEGINFDELKCRIITDLSQRGYEHTVDYLIMHIPNIMRNLNLDSIRSDSKKDSSSNQLDFFHE